MSNEGHYNDTLIFDINGEVYEIEREVKVSDIPFEGSMETGRWILQLMTNIVNRAGADLTPAEVNALSATEMQPLIELVMDFGQEWQEGSIE